MLKFTNFHYHGNKIQSLINLNDSIKLCDLENPLLSKKCFVTRLISTAFSQFCVKIPKFRKWPTINGCICAYNTFNQTCLKTFSSPGYVEAMFQIW